MRSSKIRTLIIDDDPFIHSLLKDLIEFNFPIVEVIGSANNGKEGIEKIKSQEPDLIFLDVEMTDMTGFELLSQFNQLSFQTVFVTSYNHYAIKALRMNALDYLVKPIKLEELTQAINKCKLKTKNKERNETIKHALNNLEKLVINILPKEIAKEIQQDGSAKSKYYELVTVLFADIVGFSQHAERLNPEELVEELNHYYSAFDLIVEKYGVEKIKTIGDAYMAAGGVPTVNVTNPMDTVNAALAIRDFISETADLKSSQGKKPFEFRIGVHSGPVVAGVVGVKKFAYDIWGDTVNIAARTEEKGEIGKVNISQMTYELIKGFSEFYFINRGKIKTKGRGYIEMYFVENITPNKSLNFEAI